MTEDAGMFCVSESVQKLSQLVSVAVDIADDVVHGETGGFLIFDWRFWIEAVVVLPKE